MVTKMNAKELKALDPVEQKKIKMVRVGVRMEKSLRDAVTKWADTRGLSINAAAKHALVKLLEEDG